MNRKLKSMRQKVIILVVAALLLIPALSESRVKRIKILWTESPTFEGKSFGKTGQYEKLSGKFYGELDPSNPQNAVIVDLDKAPRNAQGKVEYSSDFYILKPVDMSKGNGVLLSEYGNRGNKSTMSTFNDSVAPVTGYGGAPRPGPGGGYAGGLNDPTTAKDAGNEFLMRQGYTMVWCGILADVEPGGNRLTLQVPVAKNQDGSPIEATIWDEAMYFEDDTRLYFSYPVPRLNKAEAKLLVRERREDQPREIPPDKWDFDGPKAIKLLPEGTKFQARFIYQIIHKAVNPSVMGIGLTAPRDWVSFLRHEAKTDSGQENPLAGKIRHTISYGNSQTGRVEIEFIYLGFNQDESVAGRRVFDGMHVHVAATRPFLNFRFAQPNRQADFQHSSLYYPIGTFPFTYADQTDPFTGKTDGYLHTCTATGTCPKIIHSTTSLEYWQFKNSTVITDPLGRKDAPIPENVRVYMFTAGQHGTSSAYPPYLCEQAHNNLNYSPLIRPLLVAITDWVVKGTLPPDSRHPRIDNGTLVRPEEVAWPKIPNVTFPGGRSVNWHFVYDYGPDLEKGMITQVLPIVTDRRYGTMVPQVDADGIDIAGIRLPDISVPIATRTGWNVLHPCCAAAGELCGNTGSYIPFPRTKEERQAKGDPRLSIEERYPTQEVYMNKVNQAVDLLARERFLLEEDARKIKENAAKSNIRKQKR